jgi:hypothetical protein
VSSRIPTRLARIIDTRRTAAFRRRIAGPTQAYLHRYGLEVRHGPFAGMRYLPGLEATSGDLVGKLLGAYEAELHPAIEAWLAAAPERIVDVGSAEGYYAVGLAHALPATTVYAYDIDPVARQRCAELAALNGVQDRVVIGEACTPATLAEHPATGVALLADCEGYERVLLDPGAAPQLRGWAILVELHEFLDREITDTLRERFAATHDVDVIEGEVRDGAQYAELSDVSPADRRVLLSEHRPAHMRWMALSPRG